MSRRPGRAAARRASHVIGKAPLPAPDTAIEDEDIDDDNDIGGQSAISRSEDQEPSSPQADDVEDDAMSQDDDDNNLNEDVDVSVNESTVDATTFNETSQFSDNTKNEEEDSTMATPGLNVVRRKRLGRPPKNKPPDWDLGVLVPAGEETPRRRGRGGGRGRGGRRGGFPIGKPTQVIDKEGTTVDVVEDECVLPEDPEGEMKVDKNGYLLGGREYRCRTFTVAGRGEKLYMLSTEPARCVGFRDSYLFFTKHLRLHKIIVDDEEKRDMIERDIIPHSYKGRAIGIVTARSVFREFGARIVVGGKRITDDYDVTRAREEGAVEGELADPTDVYTPGESYNKNQYVAWHGASAVYHQAQAAASQTPVSRADVRKRSSVIVNDTNWMYEHAVAARLYNRHLFNDKLRYMKSHNAPIFDIHSNTIHDAGIYQPSVVRTENAPPQDVEALPPLHRKALTISIESETSNLASRASYTYPMSTPPGMDFLADFRGLSSIPQDVKDLLPDDCRKSLEASVEEENQWIARWPCATTSDGNHRNPTIDKAVVPFNML